MMKKIAVLTSGGDAPGMNAAVKGVARAALNRGCEVFGIRDAFKGLVEGGDQIFPLDWDDVGLFFREGGTLLGSARFPQLEGTSSEAVGLKEKALLNLLRLGISGLVVIGGDGSLTGAYELYAHMNRKKTSDPEFKDMPLSIVGIPGSIDNDIAYTDMSIGADTTLNTIVECIDKLRDTAASHKRVIIVEVMGRLRGYLAALSGLAAGADRILIREEEISEKELGRMLAVLQDSFSDGQKAGIIVRSEGAVFSTGFIKETIEVLLNPKREVRETVLGHLQRGGAPTSFERALGLRMGAKAVETLQHDISEPKLIVLDDNIVRVESLEKLLKKIKSTSFKENLSVHARHAFELGHRLEMPPMKKKRGIRIAIITEGENVSGMNMAIRAIGRLAMNQGIEVKGVKGGFEGLSKGVSSVLNLEWRMLEMKGILLRAGTLLGVSSNWIHERDFSMVKENVEKLGLHGMVVIGDHATFELTRKIGRILALPMVGIPAALNCNIQGTDWNIGMNSASNDIIKGIDRSVDTAHVKKKIGIIHLKGDYCVNLVKLTALAGGTDQLIIRGGDEEESDEFFEETVKAKVRNLKRLVDMGKNYATVLFFTSRSEDADDSINLIKRTMKEEGIDIEIKVMPQETYHGGVIPTAFDRVLAKRLGERAFTCLFEKINLSEHSFEMVGIRDKGIYSKPYDKTEQSKRDICNCPKSFGLELQDCFDLVSLPGDECVGMGGIIKWSVTPKDTVLEGVWTCKKCRHTQDISFDHQKVLCVRCEGENCSNFGYIRSSRRF